MTQSFIHVGLPKTGTTMLQRALFAQHPEICYLGKPYADPQMQAVVHAIRKHDQVVYDGSKTRAAFKLALARCGDEHRATLWSDEGFCVEAEADRSAKAERLRQLVGDASILITVRSQRTLVESMYLQFLRGANKKWPYLSVDEWLNRHMEAYETTLSGPLLRLRYDDLVQLYSDVFGRERVKVLPLERLATDKHGFADDVCNWLGVDPLKGRSLLDGPPVHSRFTKREGRYKKIKAKVWPNHDVERFMPAPIKAMGRRFLQSGSSSQAGISAAWLSRIDEIAAAANGRLLRDFGIDLRSYGYTVPVDMALVT